MEDYWVLYHEAWSELPFLVSCFTAGCLIIVVARTYKD
jgi:hypothetical protein